MPSALQAQAERWRQTAQRYDTEPETGEGRKELAARAKVKETQRDRSLSAYHMFEYGSACFQLAIVLAGAAALTSAAGTPVVASNASGEFSGRLTNSRQSSKLLDSQRSAT